MEAFLMRLWKRSVAKSCHQTSSEATGLSKKIALVGNPNVGKSVIFNNLTGTYVTVSNYPGTTVGISRGKGKIYGEIVEIVDTPGMYSLLPITEEERIGRSILITEHPDAVLHIVDAKNLGRMLSFTFQLIESGFPVILVLNIMDEAERIGMQIDIRELERKLGIPVIPTVATNKKGMNDLKDKIAEFLQRDGKKPDESLESFMIEYERNIGLALDGIEKNLNCDYQISERSIGLLLLQDDRDIHNLVREKEGEGYKSIGTIINSAKSSYSHSLGYLITMTRQSVVNELLDGVISMSADSGTRFAEKLSRGMMNPLMGIPVLILVLLCMYFTVGVFGAGFLVNWLEGTFFGDSESGWIVPYVTRFIEKIIPWRFLQDLFVHEYGVITLGFRYAIAIVLPIVGIFFIVFSIIEDTGYLPRLAMLIDRIFKRIGLSGRAIIPIVLGLGCDTMATLVTRTLETNRERIIATFLLALGIPCAAQQAIFVGILSKNIVALVLWVIIVAVELVLVGVIANKIMPGSKPSFYMELPPLRLPKFINILTKTYSRIQWYLIEIIPLFIAASVLIWLGRLAGIFDLLVNGLESVVNLIGLPANTAEPILYGFFRRDYAAAALYDEATGSVGLTGNQFLIAAVVLTLFLPCIAQLLVMIRERGLWISMAMMLLIMVLAFTTGFILNTALNAVGVQLSL